MGQAGGSRCPTAACRKTQQACPSNLHVCTWSVTSLAALSKHQDKLAHICVGRVKGFTLLQETNWTEAQPAILATAHPHINVAVSNVPSGQVGSGGVCILPPLGWAQIEHTEVIRAQQRVVNVYVHPVRAKEIGSRLVPHLETLTDSSIVLGGDFNQLPATSAWKEIVGHFSCVSPRIVTFLSSGIGCALDHLLFRHPMLDNESATVACHVRWPVVNSLGGAAQDEQCSKLIRRVQSSSCLIDFKYGRGGVSSLRLVRRCLPLASFEEPYNVPQEDPCAKSVLFCGIAFHLVLPPYQ